MKNAVDRQELKIQTSLVNDVSNGMGRDSEEYLAEPQMSVEFD